MDDTRNEAWQASYGREENFCFLPSEEVVRFISRHLRRRKAWDSVVDVLPGAEGSRVLDIGCGIGRHLVFGAQMGLEMSGIDLSQRAVDIASKALARAQGSPATTQIVCSDIRSLPWADGYFDHALSDSVLDSMSFAIAQAGVREIARVLKPRAYFYCSLISDDGADVAGAPGEVLVQSTHEQGTIQSFFNEAKARNLVEEGFRVLSCERHSVLDVVSNQAHGRWHMVLQRK